MRSAVAMALIMCAVTLAGCTKPEEPGLQDPDDVLDDPDTFYSSHYCVQNDVEPRVLAPDAAGTPWVLGDWWEYSLKIDGEALPPTRLIYYSDQDFSSSGVPQHYMVGTPTREEALHHAVFSTNPVIGRVHRLLYSPHEQGDHADMFHFPLCDGSTWKPSSLYFGEQYAFEAEQRSIALPSGSDPLGFRITGTSPEGGRVVHTFSPEAKWFTMIDVEGSDGTDVEMRLTAKGSGATGDAFFLRGQQDEIVDLAEVSGTQAVQRGDGRDGAYGALGIYMDLASKQGDQRVEVYVDSPSGTVAQCVGRPGTGVVPLQTSCDPGPLLFEVPYEAGEWQVRIESSGIQAPDITGEVRMVSIYDRSCAVGASDCES